MHVCPLAHTHTRTNTHTHTGGPLAERSALLRPTGPFTILEPQSKAIDGFYGVRNRRSTNSGAYKLRKGRSGPVETEGRKANVQQLS